MSNFIFYMSVAGCLITLGIMFMFIIIPIKLSKKVTIIICGLFVLSLATFAFYAEPSVSDDLSRHYANINRYRNSDTYSADSGLIVLQLIFRCVALFENNGWLPFFTVVIWGMAVIDIARIFFEKKEFRARLFFLYFFQAFAGCTVFGLISGIRCALVSAVWVWAYFKYSEKSKVKFIIITIILALIHYIPIILMGLYLVYKMLVESNRVSVFALSLSAGILYLIVSTDIVPMLLRGINITYIIGLLNKWMAYVGWEHNNNLVIADYFRILGVVFLLIIAIMDYMHRKTTDFMFFMLIAAMACSSMFIFFDRLPLSIGVLSLPLIHRFYFDGRNIRKHFFPILMVMVCLIQISFSVYQMIAHMRFNGVYFYNYIPHF